MDILKTLHPGDMGAKKLFSHYGEQLVCVRYRIDALNQKKFTTVELIVDEKPYIRYKDKIIAWLQIKFEETELRNKVKAAGGKWLTEHKVWELDYDMAKKLRLKNRVVKRINKNV
jgi:hypothetical protein